MVMEEHAPQPWVVLDTDFWDVIIFDATDKCPRMLTDFFQEMKENIEVVFDLRHMMVDVAENDRVLFCRMFLECGDRELGFIEWSGYYFGYLFGIG